MDCTDVKHGPWGELPRPGGVNASSSTAQEIPHILQVEIDPKFKVVLDQCAISGTKTFKFMIKLDDTNLPCVSPVGVTITEYDPYIAPRCSLIELHYNPVFDNGTPFLILKTFMARFCKLPWFFTLSYLLDTWEMSVRQACSPNPTIVTLTSAD
uniref:Mediator of RNA polymerase II transcription subunit 15 n=1 Tax=Anopheles atroparvus TaxID=41427 RepID=A0A182IJT2_ANOAO